LLDLTILVAIACQND